MKSTTLAAVIAALVVTGGLTRADATTTFVQRCNGPPASTQSGRASFVPGVNNLSTAQTVSVKVSLFHCSPDRTTRGAGILRSTVKPTGRQTCATLFEKPTLWRTSGEVVWKDQKTSVLSMTFSLTGKSHLVNVTGKVTAGLFEGHALTAQMKDKLVVFPVKDYPGGDGTTVACANKLPPGTRGRVDISALDLSTTKRFVLS